MTKLVAKHLPLIFGAILLVIVGLVAYFNRWTFASNFESEYWENYYYESQWNIPNSKRVINDEGLYRYVGYRLVNGENPFNVNYWVPPLGKYLYGLSAKYLQNPYFMSFVFYILSIFAFGLIAKEIFPSKTNKWLSIYLFALNPLLVEQVQQTMLDLPLTVFLMFSIYFLFRASKESSLKYVVLSGISLGLMAGTKFAYFVPIITLIFIWKLYTINRFRDSFYFVLSISVGYVLSYFCYWVKHPNPIPWIRLHQKIIDFYKNSARSHDWINIFRVIFLNRYKGFWVGAKTIIPLNWSVVLPTGTLGLLYVFKNKKLRSNGEILFLAVLGSVYILMNLFIDFWPRYLMPLIPILTIILVYILKNRKSLLFILFLSLVPSLYMLLFPNPNLFLKNFKKNYQSGFYRETYRMLSRSTRSKISENKWEELSLEHNENQELKLVKEGNQWKIEWN